MARRKRVRRDPAPAEIQRMCAEIRKSWNEMTHRVRAGYGKNYEAVAKQEAWSPPMIASSDLEYPVEWSN
ncbi:MAG TPA: hypothetical protein EYG57_07275 [Planctomycetes bacterium]|jgi:hypothetical protein|nr:hypothetical protein [Planctomycetaceae bacterium]HIM29342.1 hypothetical protein [Planctomycetota bacterium]